MNERIIMVMATVALWGVTVALYAHFRAGITKGDTENGIDPTYMSLAMSLTSACFNQ